MQVKGVTVTPVPRVGWLAARCGTATDGAARGRPLLDTDVKLCEAILALSGTTNGRLAAEGFGTWPNAADRAPAWRNWPPVAEGGAWCSPTPRPAGAGVASSEWSGKEAPDRRYAPFTINTEHSSPGTPSPAASTSTWTTRGSPSSANNCRSTGRRWT